MKTATQVKSALSLPFEVKATDESKRTFRGLAAAWSLDLGRDVIHQGAFARTLDRWKSVREKRPVFLLDSHNPFSIRNVLGKMTDAQETTEGLDAEFQVIDGPDGDEALRRIKGGYITGMSIGYEAVKWSNEQIEGGERWDRIRHLTEVKLLEVSLVVFPMNEDARVDVSSVKSLNGFLAQLLERHPEEKERLRSLSEIPEEFRALLEASPADAPADEPKGLAPEDAQRLAMEGRLRALNLQRLAPLS